jgi:hypothetical protein
MSIEDKVLTINSIHCISQLENGIWEENKSPSKKVLLHVHCIALSMRVEL